MTNRNTFVIVIITFFIALILFVLRHFMVNSIIENNNEEIEKSVLELVKNEYRLDGGKPVLIYPHKLDSLGNYELKDDEIEKIQSHIVDFLLKPYKEFNDSILKHNSFVPFIKYPQETDSLGNYQLTSEDMEMIKGYIQFLTEKVDESIKTTKHEIDLSIARLNLWVTIWIGVLSFLGIFVPIFLNISTTKDIDKIIGNSEEKSNEAIKKANDAENKISGVSRSLNDISGKTDNINRSIVSIEKQNEDVSKSLKEAKDKISSYEEKYNLLNEKIESIEKESNDTSKKLEANNEAIESALENATDSVEKSNKLEAILWQINSLSKIKNLNFQRLALIPEMTVEIFLRNKFNSIRSAFSMCNEIELSVADDGLFRDSLEEFVISFHQLPRYFERRDVNNKVTEIRNCIADFLDTDAYDEALYIRLDGLFNDLNELLNI